VFIPVAYHLLLLRSIARNEGDAPASLVLTRLQLQVLTAGARKPLPENPTARDAMLAIAALGGHLMRDQSTGCVVNLLAIRSDLGRPGEILQPRS